MYEIDLGLKTPAVDASIELTWRTVDAYQRGPQDYNLRKAGRTKRRGLNLEHFRAGKFQTVYKPASTVKRHHSLLS